MSGLSLVTLVVTLVVAGGGWIPVMGSQGGWASVEAPGQARLEAGEAEVADMRSPSLSQSTQRHGVVLD